jgi:hypothetical protein
MTRPPRGGARDFHVTVASTEVMRFGNLLQSCGRVATRSSEAVALVLQLLFISASESMGNRDSKIVDAGSVN